MSILRNSQHFQAFYCCLLTEKILSATIPFFLFSHESFSSSSFFSCFPWCELGPVISSMLWHDPEPNLHKISKNRNFDKIYLNSIKLGNNIKLNVLKLLFTLRFEFFASRDLLLQFIFTLREKWKRTAEMTYNRYMLKHQHILMVTRFKNLSWMADYILQLKRNFQK